MDTNAMIHDGNYLGMRPESVRMKKVLLVAPNTKESIFDSRWVTAHLGTHRVRSYLEKHGHYCEVFDCNLPFDWESYEKNGTANDSSFKDILEKIDWDIIGFSVLDATIEYDLAKIHEAKKIRPGALLVAGGSQATLNYQTLFDKSPLNMIFLIEGEFSILELCNEKPWQDIQGIVFRNYARRLTGGHYWEINRYLDIPRMHQRLYWEKTAAMYDKPDFYDINTFRLFTMNYCPVNCSFCTFTALHSHATGEGTTQVVGEDASQVVWQIEQVCKHEPETKQIFFCFHPDTEVITGAGIKKISELTGNDFVVTNEGTLHRIQLIMTREFKGDLVVIKTLRGDFKIKCTPTHRFFAIRGGDIDKSKGEWVQAIDLDNYDFLFAPDNSIIDKNDLPFSSAFASGGAFDRYGGRWYQITSIGKEFYAGPVYNLNVQKVHTYNVHGFAVKNCDDDMFLLPKRTLEVLNAIIQAKTEEGITVLKSNVGEDTLGSKETRQVRIPKYLRFICLSNINRLTEQVVELSAKAGFSVLSCGVESTSLHVLKSINKPQTPEKIEHVTRLMLKNKIRPYYTLLLFTPYCNVQDLMIDLRGFRRLSTIGVGLSIEPYLFPLHGTVFYDLDVPQRHKVIQIEGTNQTVKKGTAWLPLDTETKKIFKTWEWVYPRYKAIIERTATIKHREKNFQAKTILDCMEHVLTYYHGYEIENNKFTADQMRQMHELMILESTKDTDSVGQVIDISTKDMKMKSVRDFAMDIYSENMSSDCGRDIVPEIWKGDTRRLELPPLPDDSDIDFGDINILAPKGDSEAISAPVH